VSTNVVHEWGTAHLKVLSAVAHKAGDLVCAKGFYGTVVDDVAAGETMTLRLNPTVNFANVQTATLAMGTVVAAPATEQATTLPIRAFAAATSGIIANATTGWYPIGKLIATGTASSAKVQLFNPNPAFVVMP